MAHMARALLGTITREGLREYYDPYTGEGLGARDFAWTSLVLEMADPDPARTRCLRPRPRTFRRYHRPCRLVPNRA